MPTGTLQVLNARINPAKEKSQTKKFKEKSNKTRDTSPRDKKIITQSPAQQIIMQNPYQISPPGLKNLTNQKHNSSKEKLEKPGKRFSQNRNQEKAQSAMFDDVIDSDPRISSMI